MTLPPTRFFVEMHFPEPIDDTDDDRVTLGEMPMVSARDALGNKIGTTRIIDVEYPEPHIVRFELDTADLVLAGIDYSLDMDE